MTRRVRNIGWSVAALALVATTAFADDHGRGRGRPDEHNEKGGRASSASSTMVAARVTWGAGDVQVIRTHYASKKHGRLPPGLEKKYRRTGHLPPGWERKMEPLPVAVERRLPPLPKDHRRGVIEGRAVIYDVRGMIIDVAVVF